MNKILKNQQGISILLVVLILSSLMVLTVALSAIVLRVGKSTRQIGQSEVAFYAAETAIEKGLYEIEKVHSVENLEVPASQAMPTSGGQWTRSYSVNTLLDVDCDQLIGEGICVDTVGVITASNPLVVRLNPGNSFQIDMNFIGMNLPNNVQIKEVEKNGMGRVIALSSDGVQTSSTDSPVNLHDLEDKLYLLRLINEDTVSITFTVKPAQGDLPLGIILTGTGVYQQEKRIIEIERKTWQIYGE